MSAPSMPVLTRANALTSLRLAAAPATAWAIHAGQAEAALALFALAVATDLADGRIARRFGEASSLGGFLDHATDALFVAAGLAALAARARVPLALPILVLAAFAQYALDSRALSSASSPLAGARALRASALGRWNGVAYFVLLGIPVVRDGLRLAWPRDALVYLLGCALLATTLASMGDRLLALYAAKPRRRV